MRLLFALLLSLTLTVSLAAAFDCPGQNAALRSKGFQTLVISSASIGLTIPSGTEYAVASLEANSVRYRDDGTAPTASVGVLLPAPMVFGICQNSLQPIRFIRESADATLNVTYYGR